MIEEQKSSSDQASGHPEQGPSAGAWTPVPDDFKPFKQLDVSENTSRAEIADNLEFLLSQYQLDTTLSKRYLVIRKVRSVVMGIIGLLLIVMGFSMIFMKAPPYFEMFTIYYFTWDDGVTLMDLISLLIVFSGIFLLITAMMRLGKYGL